MKVIILKKMIKDGVSERTGKPYKIESLFVKFTDLTFYDKIAAKLIRDGATIDQVEKFCRPSEYKGEKGYVFSLNCSNYTFDRVEQFGTLDANVIFDISDAGFINAKIKVVGRKEMVNSYEPPADAVEGWTGGNEPTATFVNPEEKKEPELPSEEPTDSLPF